MHQNYNVLSAGEKKLQQVQVAIQLFQEIPIHPKEILLIIWYTHGRLL